MLIPVHFSVAGNFKFDNSSGGPNFTLGVQPGQALQVYAKTSTYQSVTYNEPYVKVADTTHTVVGLAGDAYRSDLTTTASGYAADITINGNGDTTRSQNRISDLYKETLASGYMTVYSGIGTFRTDQYAAVTFAYGDVLYTNATGLLTNVASTVPGIGRVVGTPWAFPSGVPGVGGTWGTDWFDNSMALKGGTNAQLLTFQLSV